MDVHVCKPARADVAHKNKLLLWSKQNDRLPWKYTALWGPFRIVSFTKEAIHTISQSAAAFQRNIWTVGSPLLAK